MDFYMKLITKTPKIGRQPLNTEKVMFKTDARGRIEAIGDDVAYVEIRAEFNGVAPIQSSTPHSVTYNIGETSLTSFLLSV